MSVETVADVGADDLADLRDRVSDDDLEERLAGMVEQLTNAPTRPAASKLAADQARVMVWLLDGFDDRREMLLWMREAILQSLGALDDEWSARLASNSTMVSAFLGRPWGTLEQDGVDDLPPEFAPEVRRGMVVEDLLPAFRQAHKEFRWSATERVEYLDDEGRIDDDRIDPKAQQYPAMRPSLGQLAERTEWSLGTLLDGFASRDELVMWVQSTVAILHAELDEDSIRAAYFDAPVRDMMLADGERAEFLRIAWAAEYLLPAFSRATREVAERAGEVTSEQTQTSRGGSIS
jgi:hypothetical protein